MIMTQLLTAALLLLLTGMNKLLLGGGRLLIYQTTNNISSPQQQQQWRRRILLLLATTPSPLSLHHFIKQFTSRIQLLHHDLRVEALPRAEQLRCHLLHTKRMMCLEEDCCYDLYLPSNNIIKKHIFNKKKKLLLPVLLFLPGACVDQKAYTEIAHMLSKCYGIVVAVVNLEPYRMAFKSLGRAHLQFIRKLQDNIRSTLIGLFNNNDNDNATNNINIQWAIGGHSLGAYAAMRLMYEMYNSNRKQHVNNNNNLKNNIHHLVVWAAGPILEMVPPLSSVVVEKDLKILIVLASNDGFAKFTNNNSSSKELLLQRLGETKTVYKIIQGGNHNGFASYPSAGPFDGIRSISLRSQHTQVCKLTAQFLLS